MKSTSIFKLATGVLALAALLVTSSAQAAVEQGKATVKLVKGGSPTFKNASGQGVLKVGDTIGEGTTITTGAGVNLMLDMGDNGNELQVIENTTVSFDELKLDRNTADVKAKTTLTLNKTGGLLGNVKKLSQASDFKVKYAEGVAGIRGTQWAILPGKGVVCSQGSVQVTFMVNGQPSSVTIGPGQVALPPQTPGGPPVVVNVGKDVANLLVFLGKIFEDQIQMVNDRNRGQGDVKVIISPNSGYNPGGETPRNET